MAVAKIRLYVTQRLAAGQPVHLNEAQAHYLFSVMRLAVGGQALLFNGQDGEWLAEVHEAGKRKGLLVALQQTRRQSLPPDLWLLFAPIRKARMEFIVEKAVELGAARIQPVLTEFTNAERIRRDKMRAHATEAAEQCGATYVPEIGDLMRLGDLLRDWSDDRQLIYCDEKAPPVFDVASFARKAKPSDPAAILIGPEGGFSDTEREMLHALPFVRPISLGPRILRAETAALAALSVWQASQGDWR